MNKILMTRYQEALHAMPAPGGGRHPALLAAANFGALAKLDKQLIFRNLRDAIPQGTRVIPDKETSDAINKAPDRFEMANIQLITRDVRAIEVELDAIKESLQANEEAAG